MAAVCQNNDQPAPCSVVAQIAAAAAVAAHAAVAKPLSGCPRRRQRRASRGARPAPSSPRRRRPGREVLAPRAPGDAWISSHDHPEERRRSANRRSRPRRMSAGRRSRPSRTTAAGPRSGREGAPVLAPRDGHVSADDGRARTGRAEGKLGAAVGKTPRKAEMMGVVTRLQHNRGRNMLF